MNFLFSAFSIFLLSFYLGLYFSFSFYLSNFFKKIKIFIVSPAFFWILEYFRSKVFTGFPWNPIYLPALNFYEISQPLSLLGQFGFSAFFLFLILWIAFQLAHKKFYFSGFIPVFFLFFYSIFNLSLKESGEKIKVAVVQVEVDEYKRYFYGEDFFALKMGTKIGNEIKEKPDIIIFPESLFIYPYDENLPIFYELNDLSFKFPILINANYDENGKTYNSALLILNGKINKVYKKKHLVPFGEYIPLRSFFEKIGFKKIARSLIDFDRGDEVGVFGFKIPFGVCICYEIIFPEIIKEQITLGARWISVLTNDSWYGESLGPIQHFLLAKGKAIEFGKPVVRSALTGISAIIDQKGKIISGMELFEAGYIYGEIITSKRKTPYFFLKEYPAILIIIFLIFYELKNKILNYVKILKNKI